MPMMPSVHFDAGRDERQRRISPCGQASYTLLVTTIAANVTCGQCQKLDAEGPNGDLLPGPGD